MRRGQREPFELIEVVETFDLGGAVEAVDQSAATPLRGLVPGGFVAGDRVRIAVLVLIAIRFGAVAPTISDAFSPFGSFSSGWMRFRFTLPAIAAVGYLTWGVLLLARPAVRWWYLVLLIAAVDIALSGVSVFSVMSQAGEAMNIYGVVNLIFVFPSLVVLVLGAVAWRRGMQRAVVDVAPRVLIDG